MLYTKTKITRKPLRISRTEATTLINNSRGKRFTVSFTKSNGEPRTYNGSRKNQTALGNITMRVPNKGYKSFSPSNMTGLNINGSKYLVG